MLKAEKQKRINRIYATIRKRDIIRGLLMDDNDNYNPAAAVFMKEMNRFCYGSKPAVKVSKIMGTIDPIAMAVAEGRREVLMRIIELCGFTDDSAVKMISQLNEEPTED